NKAKSIILFFGKTALPFIHKMLKNNIKHNNEFQEYRLSKIEEFNEDVRNILTTLKHLGHENKKLRKILNAETAFVTKKLSINIWHKRFGYIPTEILTDLENEIENVPDSAK
ncbi:MAG: hypothetical protein JNL74_24430, partial [Fibrobacteres bacterium]|nr:hypothetical protein [Fibrobacterota bacterium]